MDYVSTRGGDGPLGYEAALLSGLARDGGLYLPTSYPRFTADEISAMRDLSYAELAGRIMARFTDGEIDEAELAAMAADAYAGFDDPAVPDADRIWCDHQRKHNQTVHGRCVSRVGFGRIVHVLHCVLALFWWGNAPAT